MEMKELIGTGMVEVYNNQHLWNNRQTQRVYDAFADVWGTDKLWVTIDRANLNFPQRPGYEKKCVDCHYDLVHSERGFVMFRQTREVPYQAKGLRQL